MKTEICTWRLSADLKSELEREARYRKQPVSSIIETAVRDHLKKHRAVESDEEKQRRLHAALEECIGSIAGKDPTRSSRVSELVGKALERKYPRKRRVR